MLFFPHFCHFHSHVLKVAPNDEHKQSSFTVLYALSACNILQYYSDLKPNEIRVLSFSLKIDVQHTPDTIQLHVYMYLTRTIQRVARFHNVTKSTAQYLHLSQVLSYSFVSLIIFIRGFCDWVVIDPSPLWIISCEDAIQLAHGTSVVLLRCPLMPEIKHRGAPEVFLYH